MQSPAFAEACASAKASAARGWLAQRKEKTISIKQFSQKRSHMDLSSRRDLVLA